MNKTIITTAVAAIALFASSCDKTRVSANRLEGEHWKVSKITIDGSAAYKGATPEWKFEECDIYDEICEAEWELPGDDHAKFAWQFRKDGSEFLISNQSDDHDHDHDHSHDHEHEHEEVSAVKMSEELSGTYTVEESKRRTMVFKSTTTIGHAGEEVIIEIEKID